MRVAGISILIFAQSLSASHSNLAAWKPAYTTAVMESPAPAQLIERQQLFAQRNSPEGIRKLATSLFSLIDMKQVPRVRALFEKGEHQAALDAYRDFFIDRLRFPQQPYGITPRHPAQRLFVEFIHNPEEMMNGVATFCMYDKSGKNANVKLKMGLPGRVNYIHHPAGFESADPDILFPDNRFVAQCTGSPQFHTPLLVEYLKTHDRKYLLRWAEFNDERTMFWRDDVLRAVRVMPGFTRSACCLISHILPVLVPVWRKTFRQPHSPGCCWICGGSSCPLIYGRHAKPFQTVASKCTRTTF